LINVTVRLCMIIFKLFKVCVSCLADHRVGVFNDGLGNKGLYETECYLGDLFQSSAAGVRFVCKKRESPGVP
jgi:hypothetical protein